MGALRRYVYEMQRWVEAVRAGSTLDGIIPVNVSATQEHADMLSSRLGYIRDHILDGIPFPDDRNAQPGRCSAPMRVVKRVVVFPSGFSFQKNVLKCRQD